MIVRSFANGNQVADWTEELVTIPNQWGILGQSGLFQEESVETYTVQFEAITKGGGLIVDKVRGERAKVASDATSKVFAWPVPHFPLDEAISPNEIRGKRAYGSADEQEQLAAVRARKLAVLRQNHAMTLEYARFKLLTTGDVYAPSGTVALNYFTEFGVTQTSVDFDFDTGTTDVISKCEAVIAAIQDNANGATVGGVTAYCSAGFFSKLISHANVKAAYTYYTSTQEPLRNRVGGNTTMYREFFHGGIRFIEVRGDYFGNVFVPTNEAVFVPEGSDVFKTYFAPANKFFLLNTMGEPAYVFEYESERGDKIELESESNFLNAVTRPKMLVKGITG